MDTKKLIHAIVEASDDKRAEELVVLDMRKISLVSDYFFICHASNERQTKAIATSIKEAIEENGIKVDTMEGFEQGRWIVIDTGGYVLCHIFHEDERRYYHLERLWGDAERVEISLQQEETK